MPAFFGPILLALAALLESLVFKVLLGLGFGVLTYSGVGALLDSAQSTLNGMFSGLSADVLAMTYLLGVDRCINLVFSSVVARLTLQGMSALGSVSRVGSVPPTA